VFDVLALTVRGAPADAADRGHGHPRSGPGPMRYVPRYSSRPRRTTTPRTGTSSPQPPAGRRRQGRPAPVLVPQGPSAGHPVHRQRVSAKHQSAWTAPERYGSSSGRSAHHKARRPAARKAGEAQSMGSRARCRSLVQFSVGKLSPAAARASQSWAIVLGPAPPSRARSPLVTWVSWATVTYPAAASACRAGLARPEGRSGAGRACCSVTR